jgi:hypothetical protein
VDFRKLTVLAALASSLAGASWFQADEEDFRVFSEHPRLFLQPRRLRLLGREKERQSMRWRQFQQLMEGKAQWPEPGLANALYSQISGDETPCREAVRWALTPGADLRQAAIVFDWCQPVLTQESAEALASLLERGVAAVRGKPGVSAARDRVLAAIALAGHRPEMSERELRSTVHNWWRGQIVPAMAGGRDALPQDEILALFELLHAVRDNLNLDLRDPLQAHFRDLPYSLLLGYYPAAYPAPENEFYIPATDGRGQPDLRRAAMARAGDLCLVAYDSNAQGNQFLQGWLIRDTLLMRGAFGIVYEFLWANPYLPGLSYYHSPPFFHDQRLGRLYVRSNWDEEAAWLGFRDGELRVLNQSGLNMVKAQPASKPLLLGQVAVVVTQGAGIYRLQETDVQQVFLLGLRPGRTYEVKAGEEKVILETADPGGIIGLPAASKGEFAIRIRETRQ